LARTLQIDNKTVEKYLYVMRKSYCIDLIRPFWTNIRAELSKMPKVYFFDLGLRNAILDNFENINTRLDR
jgi:predicted AAA+ superfamily ATPase